MTDLSNEWRVLGQWKQESDFSIYPVAILFMHKHHWGREMINKSRPYSPKVITAYPSILGYCVLVLAIDVQFCLPQGVIFRLWLVKTQYQHVWHHYLFGSRTKHKHFSWLITVILTVNTGILYINKRRWEEMFVTVKNLCLRSIFNTVLQANEWPDDRQWPLHTWDYVYSKTTSSHLCSRCIKSPTEQWHKRM